MALQGNKPTDDPKKYGLKFDSEKIRWGLIPSAQLKEVVYLFNNFTEDNNYTYGGINITEDFNERDLLNDILSGILLISSAPKIGNHALPSTLIFKVLLYLRGKPYSKEELNSVESKLSNLKWHLLDMSQIERLAKLYTMGASKYGDYNWQLVNEDRYYDALLRHFKFLGTNEPYDSELGCLHATQVIWNLMSISWIRSRIPENIMNASKKMKDLGSINVSPKSVHKPKIVKKKFVIKGSSKKRIARKSPPKKRLAKNK